MSRRSPLALGKKMKPTRKHKPAVWEAMLGTVYAMNADGHMKGFDYDWDGALAYAGVELDPTARAQQDLRTWRHKENVRYSRSGPDYMHPLRNQYVLWIKR